SRHPALGRSGLDSPCTQAVSVVAISTSRSRGRIPSNTEEIALEAARSCLEETPCHPHDIGVLIFTGIFKSGFVGEPSYASMLAGKLLPDPETCNGGGTPLAFDLHGGANGFLAACEVLRTMLEHRKIRAGLVIAAEFDNNRLLDG